MASFPLINFVRVSGYELYPGSNSDGTMTLDSAETLAVIVGANGLGKSTLLQAAFRLITGAYDINGSSARRELGGGRIDSTRLGSTEARQFARRVSDNAQSASASGSFEIGSDQFVIDRNLADLTLRSWTFNGVSVGSDEQALQARIVQSSGLGSYADVLLMLRYVTFYLDDRRLLFWDKSAQRQLLRSLFLPNDEAEAWVLAERAAFETDSRYRNRRAILTQEQRRLDRLIKPAETTGRELRAELTALLEAAEKSEEESASFLARLSDLERERAVANGERLRRSEDADSQEREYERAKLSHLSSKFPSSADAALLIWSTILSQERCLVCGNASPKLAHSIDTRLKEHRCAVCASDLDDQAPQVIELDDERAERLWTGVVAARQQARDAETYYQRVSDELNQARREALERESARVLREARISALNAILPSSDQDYAKGQQGLQTLALSVEAAQEELRVAAARFEQIVRNVTGRILDKAEALKSSFDAYAAAFLLEQGSLTWSVREESVGQSTYKVPLPVFELQLTQGVDSISTVRDSDADVSESQREFIDLAFRMALIDVASQDGSGSIVIDTPESSLDAVFSGRAADVMTRFCTSARGDKRLVVASNLTGLDLIPRLVRNVRGAGKKAGVLDLLREARPTSALSALAEDYGRAFRDLESQME